MREGSQQALSQGLGDLLAELLTSSLRCALARQATPEDIRAGDVLLFINDELVLDKEKLHA